MESIVIDIAGMSCQGCVRSVSAALEALPGVKQVDVSLALGKASVTCDPDQVSVAAIRQAIDDAGFETPAAA